MAKYDLFLFDADGTLFDFDRAERIALDSTLTKNGIACGEEVRLAYHRINSGFWQAFERGEVNKEQLGRGRFEQLLAELGAHADGAAINEQYLAALGEGACLIDGALQVCKVFAKAGRLALVTNGVSRTQHSRFDRSEIKPCFEAIFVSEDAGFQKPQASYFDYVFDRLGVADRSRAVIIGDSLSSDIRGGMNAGIATCWYNPAGLPPEPGIRCDYQAQSLAQLPGLLLV